ncbi:MAG: DUF5336 domain-containing protein [Candidatus Sericytochromatia bacterium]
MTYSSGPGGYGGPPQGPASQGYGPQSQGLGAGPGQSKGLPFYLDLGVVVLGILSFFLGFAAFANEDKGYTGDGVFGKQSMSFFDNIGLGVGVIGLAMLLAAALIAAFSLLPAQRENGPVVAGLSVTGFISLLFLLIGLSAGANAGIGLILVLVTSFLQAALAVAVLLFSAGVIKPPAPKQPQYGYYGPASGGYGPQQPLQQGQPQQPYYGGPAPGSYQQPPSQPPQQQW